MMADCLMQVEYPEVHIEEHVEFQDINIYEDGLANREPNNNERRLYCKYCGKNFKSHNYVKMHERWHRGELNHHCPECNRAFRYPSELKKHITIHTGELPYKCDECDLRFNKAQSAHEHRIRDHVGNHLNEANVARQDSKFLQMNNYQPMSFEVVLPQRIEPKLGHVSDPLTEDYAMEIYAHPPLVRRSSVITPNLSWMQDQVHPVWREPPGWRSRKDVENNEFVHTETEVEGSKGGIVDHMMEREGANGGYVVQNTQEKEECKDCKKIMEYQNKIVELRRHNCAQT